MKNEYFKKSSLLIPVTVFLILFFSVGVEVCAQNVGEPGNRDLQEQDMGGSPWVLDIKRSTI